jgi:hypothetical protein
MIIFFLRGADRANMAGLPFPPVGAVFHEVTGVLTVVAAIFAAYSANQFLTKTRKLPPAAGGIQLAASAARAHTPAAAGRPTPPQLSGE